MYITTTLTMSKFRQFSIVLHNVSSTSKPIVEDYVSSLSPTNSVVALEPYPDQDGFHIHIFLKFTNSRSFKSVLNLFKTFAPTVHAPKPEGEERSWGRVQVDQMRGTFEQAVAYLTVPKKDKPVDPDVLLHSKPDPHAESRKAFLNAELVKFWGLAHFPDYGYSMRGYQYVELLRSEDKPVPTLWAMNYDLFKEA